MSNLHPSDLNGVAAFLKGLTELTVDTGISIRGTGEVLLDDCNGYLGLDLSEYDPDNGYQAVA